MSSYRRAGGSGREVAFDVHCPVRPDLLQLSHLAGFRDLVHQVLLDAGE